jgi:signal transduction histidine kinase/ActR/RegA family two-component response regulator
MTRGLASGAWRENLLWKGYALVALLLGVVYFLLGGKTDAQLAIYQLFILAAPIAILVGVWHHRPDRKLHWLLFAGGLGLWCVGDAYWAYYRWFLGEQAPYPSFADVAYIGGYPLLIAGGLLLVRGWGRPRIGDMLDLAIVSLAAGIVSAIFLLSPLISTSDPIVAKLIAVGFPILDFILLVVFTQLMFRRRVANFALRAIIVSTGALVVADSVYSYLALNGAYTTGMVIDTGWLACYALWPIAALHPSMARIRSLPRQETVGLSVWRIGALLFALLAAPILLIVQTLLHRHIETGEIGVVIVATTLVVAARVWLLQRDGKKGQVALLQSEERLRLSQQVASVSTWDMNLATGKLAVSGLLAAMISGSANSDATYEAWVAFIHPDDRERVVATFDQARKQGGDFEHEYRFRSPNGEEGWLLSRGRVFLKDARAVGVGVDITERRVAEEHRTKLEQQLRQAHKLEAVGRLAGGVAHDFNNILLAIRGNGELALDALKHGANAIEEVEEMVAAADRAAALTSQLLAYSRRQVLQAEVLDLNDVVRDMDKLLRRMIGADVELHAIVADDPVHVSADRSQIEQVIANLAVNARDAMPEGGLLTVEVATTEIGSEHGIDLPPGDYAKLTVNDTGAGMDSETAAKVFEPFFTTKAEGTGFGLSTVHGIVVQSGGSIWVYSEVDHGTTFKIFLPLVEQAQPLESRLPARPIGSTESAGETILLVEDDPHVQRIVRNILSRSGYRVLTAGGAAEALRLAEEEGDTIHLLLSDLVMPGISGRQLAEQIHALRPDIAILYMSGYTDDAVIRRGVLEAGMAFIQKPFGAEDLAGRVREVLDGQDRTVAA